MPLVLTPKPSAICFAVTLLMVFVFSGGGEPAQRGAEAGMGAEAGKD